MIARSRCRSRERTDEIESELLLWIEQRQPGEWPQSDAPRFGTQEGRGHDDAVVEHHRVHAHVVAVELPTPRFAGVRRSEDRHEVGPLAERVMIAGQVSDQLVDAHDRSSMVVPTRRHGGTDDLECEIAHRLRQVFEHDAVAEVIHVDVDPHPPLWSVHRKGRLLALIVSERLQERTGGIGDRAGVDLATAQRAQAGLNGSIRRHAEQRALEMGGAFIDDGQDGRWCLHDPLASRHRRQPADPERPPSVDRLLLGCADRRADGLGKLGTIRRGRAHIGKPREYTIDQRRVGEHSGGSVESLAAPGIAEHATGFAHDQAGGREVPDAAEHDDRRIERSLGDHHRVEGETLAANRLGKVKEPRHRVAPTEQRPLPRNHDGRGIGERRLVGASQRFGRGGIERTVLCKRRTPRACTTHRPPTPTPQRSRHHSQLDRAVDVERNDRSPTRAPIGIVVRAVDAVEDPLTVGRARLLPNLLAEHRVSALGADESEHRLLDRTVDFGHRSAVDLRGRSQFLRPKVLPRHRVGRVSQPVKKRDVIVGEHRHSIAEALGSRSCGRATVAP